MSWKANIQLSDLDAHQRLEVSCKTCGHTRYENPHELAQQPQFEFAWIDQVEAKLVCHARGCRGSVRIALPAQGETEGFVGGLA